MSSFANPMMFFHAFDFIICSLIQILIKFSYGLLYISATQSCPNHIALVFLIGAPSPQHFHFFTDSFILVFILYIFPCQLLLFLHQMILPHLHSALPFLLLFWWYLFLVDFATSCRHYPFVRWCDHAALVFVSS